MFAKGHDFFGHIPNPDLSMRVDGLESQLNVSGESAALAFLQLLNGIPRDIRNEYEQISNLAVENALVQSGFHSLCALVEGVQRFRAVSAGLETERAKTARLEQENAAASDALRQTQEQLWAAQNEVENLRKQTSSSADQSSAQHEFKKLVAYIPELSYKIMDSAPVSKKFNDLLQASVIHGRSELMESLEKVVTFPPQLPTEIEDMICNVDDAREVRDACIAETSRIIIPALNELCEKDDVTVEDFKNLTL